MLRVTLCRVAIRTYISAAIAAAGVLLPLFVSVRVSLRCLFRLPFLSFAWLLSPLLTIVAPAWIFLQSVSQFVRFKFVAARFLTYHGRVCCSTVSSAKNPPRPSLCTVALLYFESFFFFFLLRIVPHDVFLASSLCFVVHCPFLFVKANIYDI